ncbi:mitochondrial 37S ribosomal protein bS6m [Calcarisporiella thermophila]|uniref:mitochondrial 37S ribosomal protein bS6m n=1 Tax=Calcarisporiella thermophila TaxID=911321 RepID=UPI003742DE1C
MPFYELVCIARSGLAQTSLRDLVKTSTTYILDRGGVVRGFQNWGERELPHRIKRHQQKHSDGLYWVMQFDSNPQIVQELTRKMRVDPRVLRHTFIKLGTKLEDIVARPEKTF